MDRSTSLRRRLIAFAAAGGVFLAILVLRGPVTSAVRSESQMPPTFAGFDPDPAKALVISRQFTREGKPVTENLRLEQKAPDVWVVASSFGYPARLDHVKKALGALRDSRLAMTKTTTESRFSTYAGPEGFTEVRVLGAGDAPLLALAIGKGQAEGTYGDSYVRRDLKEGRDVVSAKNISASDYSTELSYWVEGRLFPALSNSDVHEISVDQREKSRVIELVRGAKPEKDPAGPTPPATDPPPPPSSEEFWNMTKPEAGKATGSAATNLVSALTGLTLDDLVDSKEGAEAEAKYGFDKPELIVFGSGKQEKVQDPPPTWRVTVGKKLADKDSFYVRRNAEPFVFVVAGYKLQDFRSEPVSLLEKKPEEPKEPKKPDEPAMDPEPAMEPDSPPKDGR